MHTNLHMDTILADGTPQPPRWTVKDANDLLVFIGSLLAIAAWCWRKTLRSIATWFWNVICAPNNIARIMEILAHHDFAIKTSLARSRITWNSIKSPVWESDENGLCVFVNNATLNTLRRREHDILGNAWASIIHEDDRERVVEEWTSATKERRDFNLHYRWLGSDGTVFHIHAKANRLMDEKENVLGWVSFVEILDVDGFKKGHQ